MKKFDKFPLKEPVSEFLKEINSPKDLKKLNLQQLNILADELREFLLYSVSQSGGHLEQDWVQLSLLLLFTVFLIFLMIKLFGIQDIKHTHIKF